MIALLDTDLDCPLATDGNIAIINLKSARLQSWSIFWQSPQRAGVAEYIVEQEQMMLQFLSDFAALDRLDALVERLVRNDLDPLRIALIQAQVASTKHHFSEARAHLQKIEAWGPLPPAAKRLLLSIDQACGNKLDAVLEIRQQMAAESERLEDLLPLGALLADLREFDEADGIYQKAFRSYQEVSPFALAWVCFQLGVLWGELVRETQPSRAEKWYRKAIDYVPDYVKARVHVSEIYLEQKMIGDAEAILTPALAFGDPQVDWRFSEVMIAQGKALDGKAYLESSARGFEVLLGKHLLAFADHGAEFYSGRGDDSHRAFELASVNLANRPTLRAFEQTYEAALCDGQVEAASDILSAARIRWGASHAFGKSLFADARD